MTDKVENQIPFMFRGSERLYRTIGVQGTTVYGVSLNITLKEGGVGPGVTGNTTNVLELVFASLGEIPEGSPFSGRRKGTYYVAFSANPPNEPAPKWTGQALDKFIISIGKGMSFFDSVEHVKTQVPYLQKWLDVLLESAGIMQTYTDVSEVFDFLLGKSSSNVEKYAIELPTLQAPTSVPHNEFNFDFSKFMKNTGGTPQQEDDEGEE